MIWTFLYIIFIHWIADFVFQSRQMGENKSKSNYWLTIHVLTYSCITITCWLLLMFIDGSHFTIKNYDLVNRFELSFIFIFVLHWITDYITSRITGKYAVEKRWYGFFTTIGFDQVLHYVQLFTVYNYILTNTNI